MSAKSGVGAASRRVCRNLSELEKAAERPLPPSNVVGVAVPVTARDAVEAELLASFRDAVARADWADVRELVDILDFGGFI